jgi:hypothetical protein
MKFMTNQMILLAPSSNKNSRVPPYTIYYQGPVLFEYDVNADGSGNPDWGLWIEISNEMGTALGQNPG